MSQFDIRQLKQDVGSGLCLSKKNAEVVKYPSEHIEIEENEYYNGMEKGINHIPYVESNEESHCKLASVIDKSHQNEQVKPLPASETKEVLEEIIGSYDKCK